MNKVTITCVYYYSFIFFNLTFQTYLNFKNPVCNEVSKNTNYVNTGSLNAQMFSWNVYLYFSSYIKIHSEYKNVFQRVTDKSSTVKWLNEFLNNKRVFMISQSPFNFSIFPKVNEHNFRNLRSRKISRFMRLIPSFRNQGA